MGISIGSLRLPNNVFLAPMSGVTDQPFRRLALRMGAGMVVSEMVASEELIRQRPESLLRSKSTIGSSVHVIQLAGREAVWMAEGARIARDLGADIIDINMGCPAKKVTKGLSGSALMRDLDHAIGLVRATVKAVDCPVTLKMRLGWDTDSVNATELASRAEEEGVAMVTVHGRTRCQFYEGQANWEAVADVKNAVKIPVVVNGDIADPNGVREARRVSGADAVMVGRAAYGRPWLPGRLARASAGETIALDPSLDDQKAIVIEHYEDMLSHYGAEVGVRCARKHLGWYVETALKDCVAPDPAHADKLRVALLRSSSPSEAMGLIERFYSSDELREAA